MNARKAAYLLAVLALAAALFSCGFFLGRGEERDFAVTMTPELPSLERGPATDGALVNINEAPPEELALLPGIGEVLAERIVRYREENGPFKAAEELKNVYGIGEAKLAGLVEYISVE